MEPGQDNSGGNATSRTRSHAPRVSTLLLFLLICCSSPVAIGYTTSAWGIRLGWGGIAFGSYDPPFSGRTGFWWDVPYGEYLPKRPSRLLPIHMTDQGCEIVLWVPLICTFLWVLVRWYLFLRIRSTAMQCANCGYSLIGLPSDRCPECGKFMETRIGKASPNQTAS